VHEGSWPFLSIVAGFGERAGKIRRRVWRRITPPMRPLYFVLTGALLCSGCDRTPPPPPPAPPAPPLRLVADVKQLMASILEPAAEVYWDAVGTIEDAKGVVEIMPKTDEEWILVRNSAFVVAESGNLLMMSGRARDGDEWMKFSRALVDVGQRAITAAESKNPKAVFDVGAEVYDACVACHAKYATAVMRPNAVGQ
jgi:hypothetical protein